MKTLRIIKPDDWHVHFREGDVLTDTVPATAAHFTRALAMPNLINPLKTCHDLLIYREQILAASHGHDHFEPYVTLYLHDQLTPDELTLCKQHAFILGAKCYPAGATTHSTQGVQSIKALYPIFEAMQRLNLVLQIHGEVTHGDIFDRENLFLKTELAPLITNFPKLRIVLEHITTKKAVEFIEQTGPNVAATITPHHLFYQRNDLLVGGIKPHLYCLPILKRKVDQQALQQAAVSGNPKFFAGTDSAPHTKNQKESACGCAGIYSAPYALALYTEVFDKQNKCHKLQGFTSEFGADFYHLSRNKTEIELVKQTQFIPHSLPFGQDAVIPILAGQSLAWSIHATIA